MMNCVLKMMYFVFKNYAPKSLSGSTSSDKIHHFNAKFIICNTNIIDLDAEFIDLDAKFIILPDDG